MEEKILVVYVWYHVLLVNKVVAKCKKYLTFDDKDSKDRLIKLIVAVLLLVLAGYLLYYFNIGF